MPRSIPGHIEQEEDVIIVIAVQAEDIAAALEAVGCEEAGEGLEFDGGVFVEGVFFVDFEFVGQDADDALQDGEGVGEG